MERDVDDVVREILDLAGMTQKQFAARIHVAQSTISKWLSEGHQPNKQQWDRVMRFAAANPKTRHLAVHRTIVDDLLQNERQEVQAAARSMIEIYLKSLRSR